MSTPYEDYIQSLSKWLYLEDKEGISIIIAAVIAVALPGDPIWMFVVDPPGALKTEICRSLNGPLIYSLDSLTPQTLISGFRAKKGTTIDILPDLDGKLLVIKDFTTILNKPERTRDELLGQLRSVYDGFFEQAYGSGVKKKGFHARFGILAAVTPVIEIYHKIHSLLGERFIRVSPRYNRKKSVESAIRHSGKEVRMRGEISEAAREMLDFYELIARETNPSSIPDTDKEKVEYLGDAISMIRSPVARDYKREVVYTPEAEVGTRLGKQFLRLGQALIVLDQYKYSALTRCGWDCVSSSKKKILVALAKEGVLSTKEIVGTTRLSENTVLLEGENMWMLEILVREKVGGSYYFCIEPEFEKIMRKAELI